MTVVLKNADKQFSESNRTNTNVRDITKNI